MTFTMISGGDSDVEGYVAGTHGSLSPTGLPIQELRISLDDNEVQVKLAQGYTPASLTVNGQALTLRARATNGWFYTGPVGSLDFTPGKKITITLAAPTPTFPTISVAYAWTLLAIGGTGGGGLTIAQILPCLLYTSPSPRD